MALRALVLHNFWLKFFSVLLATVIWLTIHYGINHDLDVGSLVVNRTLAQEYIRLPVTIRQPHGDTRVFRIIPDDVVVLAVGDTAALQRTPKKDIHVYLDVTDLIAKEPQIEPLQSSVPPDIYVVQISPAFVTVQQVSP